MKLKFVDSIRGVAILMVILVHSAHAVEELGILTHVIANYGQMGVQLFFVASAFTLCTSAARRRTESHPIRSYTIRRYFRIAPVYYMGILLYCLFAVLEHHSTHGVWGIPYPYLLANVASNALFVHGFYLPANNNIVPGGWSIGTEMAFYVLFPLLFLLARRCALGSIRHFLLWVLGALALSQILLLVVGALTAEYVAYNSFMYFNLANQLPVFCIGIGYFFLLQQDALDHSWRWDAGLFFLLTSLAILVWQVDLGWVFSIIPFLSGLSFLFLMELFRKFDILNSDLLIRIGQVSYSTYVIHFIFALKLAPLFSHSVYTVLGGELTLVVVYAFCVLGSVGVALLSERLIEKPFIAMGRRIIKGYSEPAPIAPLSIPAP